MTATLTQNNWTDKERELGAIITAYNDVTERLKTAHERLHSEVCRLREELALKNEELRRSERLAALGQMAAGLAHEIRNPLGGIVLYSSRLERDLVERPADQQTAAKISHGVRDLENLVSDILDFAQEGRLARHCTELSEILAKAIEAVRHATIKHGIKIEYTVVADDVMIDCDPLRLQRVILNLLLNAVQAAGPSGRVRLSTEALADGTVTIEIADNGPGIAEENLDRIFNPFFTTRASGTGLGLAIVHRIVEAHGGSIRAGRSDLGGARFVMRIPPSAEAAG